MNETCPRCGSSYFTVARDMVSTRHCSQCGHSWLPNWASEATLSPPASAPALPIKSFTLKDLQVLLPWTIKYSEHFRSSPLPHKDFAHALTHVGKAAGQLHAAVDKMDHDKDFALNPDVKAEYTKYVADLVVCALRMANTFPGGVIDLQAAVVERLETKNGVKL